MKHQYLNLEELHVLASRMLHITDITVGQFHVVVACLLMHLYEILFHYVHYHSKVLG